MSEEVLETKIDALTVGFGEFKLGIGSRLEKLEDHTQAHCTEIKVLNNQMAMMLRIGWSIFGTSAAAIIVAVLNLVMKRG